ncbi:hypothetical protein [uncultured Cellulomonas sp.]|uniref:hypothetical protein n=1 Tax=uncultured Cellulomonas sp. TaxID=189682 RepID=UPI0026370EA2|nr:hypothetical protein [uncultured Cellulomonas sp.]
MSTPIPDPADPAAHDDDLVEAEGTNAGGRPDARPPAGDVLAGGHPEDGPRSLADTEAKWHEHELAGEAWDDPDRL